MLARLLMRSLKPYRGLLVLVIAFQLAQSIASLFLPSLNADIIDDGVAVGDTGVIIELGMIMLGITVIQVVCAIAAVYAGARAAMSVGRDLRDEVFARVGAFSEREVALFGAPSLLTRTTNDVQQVQMLILMSCTMIVTAPMLSIGGVIMALREDLQLSWIMVVAVPVLLLSVGTIILRMVPWFRKMQERIDRVNLVLREQLNGVRVVRAFVREPIEIERFEKANEEVTETAYKAGRYFALMFPVVMAVLNISSVAVLWFGAFRIEEGSLEVGSLTAYLSYLALILFSLLMVTFLAFMVPRAAVSADRITKVLSTEPSVVPPAAPVTELAGSGEVEFRDATFSYPGAEQPVLRGVSFVARPGETTAIIGSTGSGKSTLINLVPRLFDVTDGAVLVDGVDVRQIDPELLWARIGLIPQRSFLFSGTIASNLRYGNPDATDEEMWEALEIAQGRDFVSELPDGLDSGITQGGTNVSGGQRQRLAIARALVKRPQIYIFDDSFSALDTATDARLRAALAKEVAGATVIVVAQRVSTILDADQIIVIEHGEIVARGTHSELLESSTEYAEIVSSQLSAEEA